MCTRARLVQAGQVSEWFGMPMGEQAAPARIALRGAQPAYLEVTIDPAAHGERGLGPVSRGVVVRTAGGQQLQFALNAEVYR